MNDLQLLSEKLTDLRAGRIGIDAFQFWVNTSSDTLSRLVPQGVLLKFKRGNMEKVMSAAISILPSCIKCGQICNQGVFANRAEHSACAAAVEKAIQNSILIRAKKPAWYKPKSGQLGPDAYYQCLSCNSIWNLVEPERHCNGLWDRVA